MSKKNIILLVVMGIVIVLLLVVYKSDFLYHKKADSALENSATSLIEKYADEELPDSTSNNTKSLETVKISDEACIEITAYALRYVETNNWEFATKINDLKKKYGVDLIDSEYFDEYCNERVQNDEILEKVEEKMRELGSDIE